MAKLTLDEVNKLDVDTATALLGGVFEDSPWIVAATWDDRPFVSLADLHIALSGTVQAASDEDQLTLIRAHPDLVGEAARRGSLTKDSTAEQREAGLSADDLTPEEIDAFGRLNEAYRERFGFPFVICARENRKDAILEGFRNRLGHDAETERLAALEEIERIAWYRLVDLIDDRDVPE